VSIVMPTYDRQHFLLESVASIFSQTFRDWELIVADDGSGESVLEYLGTLERHDNVRILRRAHSGNPGKVRNAGIAEARGSFVAFMDSDDLWTPTKLEKQFAMLRAQPECRWCYTAFVIVDAHGVTLASERTRRWTAHGGDIFDQVVRGQASIRTPSVVARTEFLREVGAFDETIDCAEDYDLWARLALRSPACVVDEPLVRVRRYPRNDEREVGRAHVARDRSLRKLASQLAGRRRALVLAERSRNALARGAALVACGNPWRGVGAVASSLPLGWRYPGWWFGCAKLLVRACFRRRGVSPAESSSAASSSADAVETRVDRPADEVGAGRR
jgi:glycosyltransferase involved in cell wall biosynthesis